MSSSGKASGTGLRTGVAVPKSGSYRVYHPQHSLPQEVTLLKDHSFPRCSRCGEPCFTSCCGLHRPRFLHIEAVFKWTCTNSLSCKTAKSQVRLLLGSGLLGSPLP